METKWNITLSTTEPYNYVGIIKVRQGNSGTERIAIQIIENNKIKSLLGLNVYFETLIDGKPVQEQAKIVDAENGIIEYTFTKYSMQNIGVQEAYFSIIKNDQEVGSTQNFKYFVINAVSTTPIEAGSYWQTLQDLLDNMKDFINHNQGDFNNWFESVKEILYGIDPGGKIIQELIEARYSIDNKLHTSLKSRLKYDFNLVYDEIAKNYALFYKKVETDRTLQDDKFSSNFDYNVLKIINTDDERPGLVIANVSKVTTNRFYFEKVGDIV